MLRVFLDLTTKEVFQLLLSFCFLIHLLCNFLCLFFLFYGSSIEHITRVSGFVLIVDIIEASCIDLDRHFDLGGDGKHAFDFDFSSLRFKQELRRGQAQSDTFRFASKGATIASANVLYPLLFRLPKCLEQLVLFIVWDAISCVLDRALHKDLVLMSIEPDLDFNEALSFVELDCVDHGVKQGLLEHLPIRQEGLVGEFWELVALSVTIDCV